MDSRLRGNDEMSGSDAMSPSVVPAEAGTHLDPASRLRFSARLTDST